MELSSHGFEPYYVVIFTSRRTEKEEGYNEMAQRMEELVKGQEGYLGHDRARSEVGITISYWSSLESIRKWKLHSEHLAAQQKGKSLWYAEYTVRVCRVEREYHFGSKL
mgnify:CR=1 FL=1